MQDIDFGADGGDVAEQRGGVGNPLGRGPENHRNGLKSIL
jgi:hypothetical protein